MNLIKNVNLIFGTVFLCSIFANAQLQRPPQYVVLSFDGSKSLSKWQETRQFARENNLKFTYFISGVYYIKGANKNLYVNPTHGIGKSAIGFGGDAADIKQRIYETLKTEKEGNEIASHVNGHYGKAGKFWNYSQWRSEIDQFVRFLSDIFSINGLSAEGNLSYEWSDMLKRSNRGMRAPMLEYNDNMYRVMTEENMTYDTSQVWKQGKWPLKKPGTNIWITPLNGLGIAGTAKKTLSMDYNFYYSQSGGKDNLQNANLFQQQMFDTYMTYFKQNYNGNRAPVIIGHHFSDWNGGAYWRALQSFAKNVCRMPEVKCVTHKELVGFLNENSANIAKFQRAEFSAVTNKLAFTEPKVKEEVIQLAQAPKKNDNENLTDVFLANMSSSKGKRTQKVKWEVNNYPMNEYENMNAIDLKEIMAENPEKIRMIVEEDGIEIQSTTYKLKQNSKGQTILDGERLENKALTGDMPEAHESLEVAH